MLGPTTTSIARISSKTRPFLSFLTSILWPCELQLKLPASEPSSAGKTTRPAHKFSPLLLAIHSLLLTDS